MRNGSATNERSINTTKMTGKNERQKSTKALGLSTASTPSLARRLGPSQSLSSTQTMPVSRVSSDRMVAKSHCTVCMICVSISVEPLLLLFLDAQHREECFLRNLDGADLFHAQIGRSSSRERECQSV